MDDGKTRKCEHRLPPGAEYCRICALELAGTELEGAAPARPRTRSETAPPLVFGDYELLEKIGEGGMGVVYRARQRGLNRDVALKLMRSGPHADASEIKRFRSEAQAAARLQHSNIVGVYEVGEQDGHLFFSMEYVAGETLSQLIRLAPLPPREAARLVGTIAEAIHYAHDRRVLHRDLKPANILLERSGKPRVTDFGLARQIETDSDLTLSGAVLGTPSYMPPEQAMGKSVTFRSDVYSLGAILYDCLTGRPPFRADTPVDTCRQVVDTEPVSPRLLNPKVPVDLETICLKCLAKDPSERYSTAQELADDLARFGKGEPIHARPIRPWVRLWRWSERNPALSGMGIAVLVLTGMLGLAGWLSRQDAIGRNSDAAALVCKAFRQELDRMSASVETQAGAPTLVSFLEQLASTSPAQAVGDCRPTEASRPYRDELQRWLSEIKPGPSVASFGFTNWAVLSPKGCLLGRWPLTENLRDLRTMNPEILLRADRDYFIGANQQPDSAYFSKVYRSADDGAFKFGIAKIVRGQQGQVLGVLEAMVTTSPGTELFASVSRLGQVVLVGETDPAAPPGKAATPADWPKALVICHPSFQTGSSAFPVSDERLGFLFRSEATVLNMVSEYRYRDPIGDRDPKYRGRWLAAKMRVPGTHFVVIYQTRDRVFDALWRTAMVVASVAVAVFSVWFFRWSQRKE